MHEHLNVKHQIEEGDEAEGDDELLEGRLIDADYAIQAKACLQCTMNLTQLAYLVQQVGCVKCV